LLQIRYGDPGFRYTHHDVGHQISSLAFAAAAQNASVVLLDGLSDGELGALLRADAPEDPVCLLALFPADAPPPPGREQDWWRTFTVGEDFWAGAPPPAHHGAPVEVRSSTRGLRVVVISRFSPCLLAMTTHSSTRLFPLLEQQVYYGKPEAAARPIIASAREAGRRLARVGADDEGFWSGGAPPRALPAAWAASATMPPLRQLIHERRSAQSYDADAAPPGGLPAPLFFDILRRMAAQPAWFPWKPAVQPFLFVHRVAGLQPGIYLLCRGMGGAGGGGSGSSSGGGGNSSSSSGGGGYSSSSGSSICDELRPRLDPRGVHLWQAVPGAPADMRDLVLLRAADVRDAARLGSCTQEIASESAFAVAFLAEHLPALKRHGAWWYKREHWEACALGGALYLAAGAAGDTGGGATLQATGIGCFFAPWVQSFLEVDAPAWADVYHFTMGWPAEDRRVDVTGDPYAHVDELRGQDRDTVDSRGQ